MTRERQAVLRSALSAALLTLAGCDSYADGASHDSLRAAPAAAGVPELPELRLVRAFPALAFERPLAIVEVPDGTRRLFVVTQGGVIFVFKPDPPPQRAAVFLDISRQVLRDHNEEGLLSLAFHPNYATNGLFFVWYSAGSPRRHVLSRFKVSDDPARADPASERVVLEIDKPYGNHNGSTLLFGKDGFLYFSVGDGGAAGDPHNNGQHLASWLAKIHRINVDRPNGDKAYSVPQDNPFVGRKDTRAEIWAYGLRNVWRMSFDRETGELWAGDVGQDRWEEVDVIVKGGNYGWRVREGSHAFHNQTPVGRPIDPVVEYGRADGASVTGGYVYRGKKMPRLAGAYVYADYVSGTIWALRRDHGKITAWREVVRQRKNIASFGEDSNGELYVCCFDGRIYALAEK